MSIRVYAGQFVRASDVEIQWARKTSDESVTSSTTLQNDDTLLLPVRASSVYRFTALVGYVGNTTGDIKLGFTFPSGATCHWAGKGASSSDDGYGTTGASKHSAVFGEVSGTATSFAGSTSNLAVLIEGILITGTTAGNLTLQWAQNTSNGTATTVKAGSFLELSRRE